MAKRALHPVLQENADRLKRGETLYKEGGSKKGETKPQRPKIRSKQKKG